MKFRVFSIVVFLLYIFHAQAAQLQSLPAYASNFTSTGINIDSLVQYALTDTLSKSSEKKILSKTTGISKSDSNNLSDKNLIKKDSISVSNNAKITATDSTTQKTETVQIDSTLLLANPFFIDLVYNGLSNKDKLNSKPDLKALFYGKKVQPIPNQQADKQNNPDEIIVKLRTEARDQITREAANLYIMSFDQLPDPNGNRTRFISKKSIRNLAIETEEQATTRNTGKLIVKNPELGPWQYKASSMAQFSESVVSPNWYQGGNSNLAVLGIVMAQLSYDDKKRIQWDNTAEWRLGFNSVSGDTLHWLSTNDDILKINSKLGIKAGGNFFYSGSVDFSTQFFNSYNGVNSKTLKTAFLTPIRLNIGVGLDYKYKKILSLMISPVSYKYIFMSDNVNVNPNLFGIQSGQKVLSELGSSFKAIYSYPATKEIQLDSKFSFYTNYQKVEIDWEIVANMSINRFLSTRISFNPRYDNTIIEKDGSVARLQFKQFLSVGFSHKFL